MTIKVVDKIGTRYKGDEYFIKTYLHRGLVNSFSTIFHKMRLSCTITL